MDERDKQMYLSTVGDGSMVKIEFPDGSEETTTLYKLYSEFYVLEDRDWQVVESELRSLCAERDEACPPVPSDCLEINTGLSPCLAKTILFSSVACPRSGDHCRCDSSECLVIEKTKAALSFISDDLKKAQEGILSDRGVPAVMSLVVAGDTFAEHGPGLADPKALANGFALEVVRSLLGMNNSVSTRFLGFLNQERGNDDASDVLSKLGRLEESLATSGLEACCESLREIRSWTNKWAQRCKGHQKSHDQIDSPVDRELSEVAKEIDEVLESIGDDPTGKTFVEHLKKCQVSPYLNGLVRTVVRHAGARYSFSSAATLPFLCIHLVPGISETEKARHRVCKLCEKPFISNKDNVSCCDRECPDAVYFAKKTSCYEYRSQTTRGRATWLVREHARNREKLKRRIVTCERRCMDTDAKRLYDESKHAMLLITRGYLEELYSHYKWMRDQAGTDATVPDRAFRLWFNDIPGVSKKDVGEYKRVGAFYLPEIARSDTGSAGEDQWSVREHAIAFPKETGILTDSNLENKAGVIEEFAAFYEAEGKEIARRIIGENYGEIPNVYTREYRSEPWSVREFRRQAGDEAL